MPYISRHFIALQFLLSLHEVFSIYFHVFFQTNLLTIYNEKLSCVALKYKIIFFTTYNKNKAPLMLRLNTNTNHYLFTSALKLLVLTSKCTKI